MALEERPLYVVKQIANRDEECDMTLNWVRRLGYGTDDETWDSGENMPQLVAARKWKKTEVGSYPRDQID